MTASRHAPHSPTPRTGPRAPEPPAPAARAPITPDGSVPLADLLAAVRPPAEQIRRFTDQGHWRSATLLHDLHRNAAAHPHRTAIVAHRAHHPAATRVLRISYGQLVGYADRFAHALDALGVRAGDPVAFQLPNRWETCALLLACLRIGAVAVPVMAGYGARDLESVLGAAQARICVVPDRWEGTTPAQVLADLAPTLPWLRHRVVLGDAAATGAVDFTRHFVHTPHERYRRDGWLPLPAGLADRISLAVTSLGLHRAHSMAMHTPNTLHAGLDPRSRATAFTALPLATLPSLLHTVVGPLTHGTTVVLQDVWDPETALDLMASADVRAALATPAQWAELVAAQEQRPRPPGPLKHALLPGRAGTTTLLAHQVHETLRVPLDVTTSGARDADGDPAPADTGHHRPYSRGPASPLAVWQRESGGLRPVWDGDDPTDTGLPAGPHEEDRTVEEVGGVFLVPVTEVEEHLLAHPHVAEAAVVASTDPEHGELACAVVVPEGDPPSLLDLRAHLLARGILTSHLPARLELVPALPRSATGRVLRHRLQDTLPTT
ncbi:AMP-binding protein [Streptomyces sp. NPDC058642]|uniref:AMP-binding protein n=1 Tax=Streptomyces sp. NPDC058642 TaxID=3346572 RepID=UPI003650A4FB